MDKVKLIINKIGSFLDLVLYTGDEFVIDIRSILLAFLILLIANIAFALFSRFVLKRYFKRRGIEKGRQYAFIQILKYVFYVFAFFVAIQSTGLNISILLAGSAALLVGVGLGLQQTFNDLFSGIILLFEGSVQVDNIVDINGLIGQVKKIGIRTSVVETRDKIMVIVPNSKFIADNVVNWSHGFAVTRFKVDVGVAYGSDVLLVKELLLKCADEHALVNSKPGPTVRFMDFADSSLNFSLLFWTEETLLIEDTKSDLRFSIDAAFRANNVSIPFPQRDINFKNILPVSNDLSKSE